jgi:hypothetical protein
MEILSKNKDVLDYFNTAISNYDNNIELEVIFGSFPRNKKKIEKKQIKI